MSVGTPKHTRNTVYKFRTSYRKKLLPTVCGLESGPGIEAPVCTDWEWFRIIILQSTAVGDEESCNSVSVVVGCILEKVCVLLQFPVFFKLRVECLVHNSHPAVPFRIHWFLTV
jgi:hypothetical protein